MFTKLIREITVAAKAGGGDPSGNPRLRVAIEAAKASSMPRENIERAVKKGTGELEGVDYVEVMYEGYGPGGVALLVHALTDNPTRTVAEVRFALTHFGGNFGATNSVAWMFDRKGQIYVDASKFPEDIVIEAALEGGAEDVVTADGQHVITTDPTAVHAVRTALEAKKIAIQEAEITMLPKNTVKVEGKNAESVLKLMEELEDLDDVQKVESNFDIDLAEMAKA
jgi:YebC/PmpR family DNA-binding regulatory protein